ncbi:MAG: hypothetical protein R8K47_00205, partial [Mariprofundaceae bacterium]
PAGIFLSLGGRPPPFPPRRVFLREDRRPPLWLAPTLIEELTFGLPAFDPRQVEAVLADWGLDGLDAALPVDRLDREQALRLFLAAAEIADARLVLLDEPLAGFPAGRAEAMAGRIAHWARAGRIVVVASNRWQDWASMLSGDARVRRWRVEAPDALPFEEDA